MSVCLPVYLARSLNRASRTGGSCPPPNRRRPLEDDDNAISPRKLKFSAPFNAPKPSKAAIERERLGLPKPSVQASPSSVYKKPSSIFDLNRTRARLLLQGARESESESERALTMAWNRCAAIAVRVDLRHAGLIPCPLDVALLNAYDVYGFLDSHNDAMMTSAHVSISIITTTTGPSRSCT